MYKILDLKRVFSTFQETVWSLLNHLWQTTNLMSAQNGEFIRETELASRLFVGKELDKNLFSSQTNLLNKFSCYWIMRFEQYR